MQVWDYYNLALLKSNKLDILKVPKGLYDTNHIQ